ncbi:myosin-8-like [Dorcoceras hygrometricum]|uniref:Myosin-8-like n=1 Tax=Dorcoceras hygrometricum TaxID=472368 RepID=A0A2Z7CND3_9LAMI|nr:myosin-8-like [Dorcoceras hygrometricum]
MAQYQILDRKLLGPPGTGPKRTLEVKNSVATPPRVRRTAVARRRPPPAQDAAHCHTLRAARPAIGNDVLIDPSLGSDTTVGAVADPDTRSRAQRKFQNFASETESGTSTVDGVRSPNPVHDWKQDSFVIGTSPITASYGGAAAERGVEERGIQLAVGSQPLRLRNHNFGLTHRIMVKRLATSPHDPLGITDSASKNQSVMVSVQYGPFNTYIPIRSRTIGISRVVRDPISMHTSRRSNGDIMSVTSSAVDVLEKIPNKFCSFFQQDSQDLRTFLSLDLSTTQKKLSTQVSATALDNFDGRKEVKELNAKVTYLDGQVAAIRNDLLNFHAKPEENHLNLSTQLDFLIDYINRGGDAKKEESGSNQPRPPPDDQSRPSGGSGDSGSQRRSGSSKGRRLSGESPVRGIRYGPYPPGAPPKRIAKY